MPPSTAGRLVDRAHGFDHAEHGRDDAQSAGSPSDSVVSRSTGCIGVGVMGFDGGIDHLLDGVRADPAGRHHQQAQAVGEQMQEHRVFEKLRIFGENGAGLGVFDVWLERHRAIGS